MKFVVDEDKWLRGNPENSELLTSSGSNGKMCCLGFVARQSGIKKKDILHIPTPAGISSDLEKMPEWLLDHNSCFVNNSDVCGILMKINDDRNLLDSERKQKIREIFKKHGDQIIFKKGTSK